MFDALKRSSEVILARSSLSDCRVEGLGAFTPPVSTLEISNASFKSSSVSDKSSSGVADAATGVLADCGGVRRGNSAAL